MRCIVLVAAFLAGACQSPLGQHANAELGVAARATGFLCADGSIVEASYPTTDTARLVHKGRTIDMAVATSASGSRYVGGGWEWWTKGVFEGTLSPLSPGEDLASAPGVICTAGRDGG